MKKPDILAIKMAKTINYFYMKLDDKLGIPASVFCGIACANGVKKESALALINAMYDELERRIDAEKWDQQIDQEEGWDNKNA